jgi:hypothetical protein
MVDQERTNFVERLHAYKTHYGDVGQDGGKRSRPSKSNLDPGSHQTRDPNTNPHQW